MEVTSITAPGNLTLVDLEQAINTEEGSLGPVVDLGNDGLNSVVTFNMSDPPPTVPLVLRATPGGQPPQVPGSTFICQGNCLVSGQLMGVAAFRASTTAPAVTPPPIVTPPPVTVPAPSVHLSSSIIATLTKELPVVLSFKAFIDAAVATKTIPASLIAGIGWAESGWGTSPLMKPTGPTGTGDATPRSGSNPNRPGRSTPTDGKGFGRGLMQIDWDAHEFARTGNWQDPEANIEFGVGVLADFRQSLKGHVPDADLLTVAVAAYNAGVSGALAKVRDHGVAAVSAPETYAFKVLQLAAFYRQNGFS
jgi:hypothetical protein